MTTTSNLSNISMRQAFLNLMGQTGRPLERVVADQPTRGPAKEVYRVPDGKTVRLRTNNMPALMVKVDDGTVDVPLPFENEDFVGIAFPAEQQDTVVGYLVPTAVATKAIRAMHRKWLADETRSRDNKTRVVRFDGNTDLPWRGYAQRWAQYRIGEIEIGKQPVSSALDLEIAASRKRIAALTGRPENAIKISIEF